MRVICSVRVALIASDQESACSHTTDQHEAADLPGFYASEILKAAAQVRR
jgi:hypothetical protein